MTDISAFGFAPAGRMRKVPAVHRNFAVSCLLVAWLCANGAVWNVVQVAGWARMIRDYAQVMPVARAVELTFDGTAPCDLCHLAQEGQDATRDLPASPAALGGGTEKILLIADCVPGPVLVAPDFSWPGVVDAAGRTRTEPVPVPPPRV
jgi:hypothetical protein